MRLLERLRERLRIVWDRDQVDVIRHQAIAQQREAVKLGVLPQQLKVGDAIGIADENDLSSISSLGDMMRNVDDYDAGQSSHKLKITGERGPLTNAGCGLEL